MMELQLKPIGYIYNDYTEKFGIPRQSGINDSIISSLVLEEEYSDINAFRGIDNYNYIWIIWGFSEFYDRDRFSPMVKPPRLGGNRKMGVFATRSPNRPNKLGLSSVRIRSIGIEKKHIKIEFYGADMMNGTPVYDIKPYLPDYDIRKDAYSEIEKQFEDLSLQVEISDDILSAFPPDKRGDLMELLKNDPRPQYSSNENEAFAISFAGYDIHFHIKGKTLTVYEIVGLNEDYRHIK